MNKFLLITVTTLMTYQTQASADKIYTCEEGDYYISLQVSTGRGQLIAGICEFTSCAGEMTMTGRRNPVDSEGNRKTYEIDGPSNEALVVYFNAEGDVSAVERASDSVVIQSFNGCTAN